jgi:hypothetical protein
LANCEASSATGLCSDFLWRRACRDFARAASTTEPGAGSDARVSSTPGARRRRSGGCATPWLSDGPAHRFGECPGCDVVADRVGAKGAAGRLLTASVARLSCAADARTRAPGPAL